MSQMCDCLFKAPLALCLKQKNMTGNGICATVVAFGIICECVVTGSSCVPTQCTVGVNVHATTDSYIREPVSLAG